LNLCHSTAVDLDKLLSFWLNLCLKLSSPACIDGYLVLIADGIKIGKEGKKIPAVKLLHQDSQSNAKASYIMGHYLQSVSLIVISPLKKLAAVPIVAQIHDGLVSSNRSNQTCITRLADLICKICLYTKIPAIVVADAYYSSKMLVDPLKKAGCQLICRVKHNTCANLPLPPIEKRGRGRPKLKGDKVKLSSLFEKSANSFTVLDDKSHLCIDLYWPPAGRVVRFVLVESPKGRTILMSTDTFISPETIIKAYEARWMIETGFKTAKHQLGSFSYHFWMKAMKKTKYGQLKQYTHRESEGYRAMIQRKMHSYHTYMAFGCICQGLLIHLALNYRHAAQYGLHLAAG
jgi:hypothetical protein